MKRRILLITLLVILEVSARPKLIFQNASSTAKTISHHEKTTSTPKRLSDPVTPVTHQKETSSPPKVNSEIKNDTRADHTGTISVSKPKNDSALKSNQKYTNENQDETHLNKFKRTLDKNEQKPARADDKAAEIVKDKAVGAEDGKTKHVEEDKIIDAEDIKVKDIHDGKAVVEDRKAIEVKQDAVVGTEQGKVNRAEETKVKYAEGDEQNAPEEEKIIYTERGKVTEINKPTEEAKASGVETHKPTEPGEVSETEMNKRIEELKAEEGRRKLEKTVKDADVKVIEAEDAKVIDKEEEKVADDELNKKRQNVEATKKDSELISLLEKKLNDSYGKYIDELDKTFETDPGNATDSENKTRKESHPKSELNRVTLTKDDPRLIPEQDSKKHYPNKSNVLVQRIDENSNNSNKAKSNNYHNKEENAKEINEESNHKKKVVDEVQSYQRQLENQNMSQREQLEHYELSDQDPYESKDLSELNYQQDENEKLTITEEITEEQIEDESDPRRLANKEKQAKKQFVIKASTEQKFNPEDKVTHPDDSSREARIQQEPSVSSETGQDETLRREEKMSQEDRFTPEPRVSQEIRISQEDKIISEEQVSSTEYIDFLKQSALNEKSDKRLKEAYGSFEKSNDEVLNPDELIDFHRRSQPQPNANDRQEPEERSNAKDADNQFKATMEEEMDSKIQLTQQDKIDLREQLKMQFDMSGRKEIVSVANVSNESELKNKMENVTDEPNGRKNFNGKDPKGETKSPQREVAADQKEEQNEEAEYRKKEAEIHKEEAKEKKDQKDEPAEKKVNDAGNSTNEKKDEKLNSTTNGRNYDGEKIDNFGVDVRAGIAGHDNKSDDDNLGKNENVTDVDAAARIGKDDNVEKDKKVIGDKKVDAPQVGHENIKKDAKADDPKNAEDMEVENKKKHKAVITKRSSAHGHKANDTVLKPVPKVEKEINQTTAKVNNASNPKGNEAVLRIGSDKLGKGDDVKIFKENTESKTEKVIHLNEELEIENEERRQNRMNDSKIDEQRKTFEIKNENKTGDDKAVEMENKESDLRAEKENKPVDGNKGIIGMENEAETARRKMQKDKTAENVTVRAEPEVKARSGFVEEKLSKVAPERVGPSVIKPKNESKFSPNASAIQAKSEPEPEVKVRFEDDALSKAKEESLVRNLSKSFEKNQPELKAKKESAVSTHAPILQAKNESKLQPELKAAKSVVSTSAPTVQVKNESKPKNESEIRSNNDSGIERKTRLVGGAVKEEKNAQKTVVDKESANKKIDKNNRSRRKANEQHARETTNKPGMISDKETKDNVNLTKKMIGGNESKIGLNETEIGLNETNVVLNVSKTGLNESLTVLNENETGLNENKTGLNESAIVLNETAIGLNETITGLNETKVNLNETIIGLNETEIVLNETQMGLNRTGLNESMKSENETKNAVNETRNDSNETNTVVDKTKNMNVKKLDNNLDGDTKHEIIEMIEKNVIKENGNSLMSSTKNKIKNKERTWETTENKTYHVKDPLDNATFNSSGEKVQVKNPTNETKVAEMDGRKNSSEVKDESGGKVSDLITAPVNKTNAIEASRTNKTDENAIPTKTYETNQTKTLRPNQTEKISKENQTKMIEMEKTNETIPMPEANETKIDEVKEQNVTNPKEQKIENEKTINAAPQPGKSDDAKTPEENGTLSKLLNLSLNNNTPVMIVDFKNISQLDSLLYSLLPKQTEPHLISFGIKIISVQESNKKLNDIKNYDSRFKLEDFFNDSLDKKFFNPQIDSSEQATMDNVKEKNEMKFETYLVPMKRMESIEPFVLKNQFRIKRDPRLQNHKRKQTMKKRYKRPFYKKETYRKKPRIFATAYPTKNYRFYKTNKKRLSPWTIPITSPETAMQRMRRSQYIPIDM